MLSYIIIALILIIFTYIAMKDWQTGLISLLLNFIVLLLAVFYAVSTKIAFKGILINLLIYVLPFILTEVIFQVFFNKEKDDNKFLIGGGDIILFTSMSIILSIYGMMIMFFFASLTCLIASKIIKEKRVPFAPFLEFGFIIAIICSYIFPVIASLY